MPICPNCGLQNVDAASFCSDCGTDLRSPGATPPGRGNLTLPLSTLLHGQYLILKKLAEGGMGAVYLAQDQALFGRMCVVKEMLPYYTTPAEKVEAQAKFEREARLLATLSHPGIPQVFDFFVEQGRHYLVMQFVAGDNLEKRLAQAGGPLPEREVIEYAAQVASVLVYIGAQNPPVIHRDIKPANIILDTSTGQVRLVDFGIAREAQAQAGPAQSSPLGTIGYSPPEQFSQNTEPRSDVFALGATMHHLLSNQDPRSAPRLFYYAPLRQLVPSISPALEALVGRMLESDPAQRPSAADLRSQLKALGTPGAGTPAGPFAMRGGTIVHDLLELTQACDRNWDDGIYHLFNGHLEPWLEAQNRHDLAGRAETIRKKAGDPNAGLEEFLRAVNPTIPLPSLKVTPQHLLLGSIEKGSDPKLAIEIENVGRGYLSGDARALVPWAKLTPETFGCKRGEKVSLVLELDTGQLAEGNVAERVLILSSNGGQVVIDVQFLLTWQPRLAVDAASLDLGEVLQEDLGQSLSSQFTITNKGGGLLEGSFLSPAGWVLLGARDFRLVSGQSMVVAVMADTGQLQLARSETAPILVQSTGGALTLPVRVGVVKAVYKQRGMRWAVYGSLLFLSMLGWSIASALSVWSLTGRQRDSTTAAIWLVGALLVSWIAMRIARRQILLLDEIEIYYHRGDLVNEIPVGAFDVRRLMVTAAGMALAGLLLGISYHRVYGMAWPAPVGALAGALLGALWVLGSGPWTQPGQVTRLGGVPLLGGNPARFGTLRMLAGGLAMAFLGTLALRSPSGTKDLVMTVWWAMLGLMASAEAYPHLPLRIRWLLGKLRPGLLCMLLAYVGWLAGTVIVYRVTFPLVDQYAHLPPFGLGFALKFLVAPAFVLGGAVLGLLADNSCTSGGQGRRSAAMAMGRALVPGMAVVLAGFLLGRLLFGLSHVTGVRGWGALACVVAAESCVAWLRTTKQAQVTQMWARVRATLEGWAKPLAAKVKWPQGLPAAWKRISGKAGSSTGGWLSTLTLPMALGAAGTLAVAAPAIAYVCGSLLRIVGYVALVAVPLAVLVLVFRYLQTR